jgi:hypothetical protein
MYGTLQCGAPLDMPNAAVPAPDVAPADPNAVPPPAAPPEATAPAA